MELIQHTSKSIRFQPEKTKVRFFARTLYETFTLAFSLNVPDILVDGIKYTGRAPLLSLGWVQ